MELRTYYWDAVGTAGPLTWKDKLRGRKPAFRVGNAGDLYNIDLIQHLYGIAAHNTESSPRLLLVGSVVHRAARGDILCGVGTKGIPLAPPKEASLEIRGVRGPLTLAALADAGHDVSDVRFAFDPGLLVGEVYSHLVGRPAVANRVVFIPHYRDRDLFRSSDRYDVVDIDCEPAALVEAILAAEMVYSSSLHGIVFAHALGRPCVLVAPVRGEADTKYRDYYASVGLRWRVPDDLDVALGAPSPSSPLDLRVDLADFSPPTLDELVHLGCTTGSSSPGQPADHAR